MDSFLTTLYFAYFRAVQNVLMCKELNLKPKAAGQFDITQYDLDQATKWQDEVKELLTEYTLILKNKKNNNPCEPI